jgi:hypothetical protein
MVRILGASTAVPATVAALAATLVGALALPSVAQSPTETIIEGTAKVIPNRAGTPRNPQGVKIRFSGRVITPPGVEKPVITHGFALLPDAGEYNGGRYPKCSKRKLDRQGERGCPRGSLMGRIRATAWADNEITRPRIAVYNGGARLALAYVTLFNPAFVQEAIPVRVKKLRRGKWGYKVSLRVPKSLQIVTGVPISPRSARGTIGRDEWITTTSCPKSRRWPYVLKAFFNTGESYTLRDSTRCRPPLRRGRR